MHSSQLKRALGLPARLPVEGTDLIMHESILYYVQPLVGKPTRRRRMSHRLRAICPACLKDVSAGRLDQHLAIHN